MRIGTKWRLVATVALVLYGALVLGVVWWLAHNILFALFLGIATGCFVYGGWLIFTSSGKRARKGYLFAGLSLALVGVAVMYLARHADVLRGIIVVAAAAALYLLLLTALRKYYWSQARTLGQHEGHTRFAHPFLIVNPKSGDGRAIRAHIPELAQDMGIKVLLTKKGDDVEALARRAVAQGADVLGVSGGDGSLGAVAKVAIEHGLPMVVLPGGTRCHFARDIGLSPKRIADALQGFFGVERRVDVANMNGRIVLNNVSFGLYADIIDNPDYRDHKHEVSRRTLRALLDGAKHPYRLQFRYKGHQFYEAVQILIGVNRYTTLDVFELGHRERLDEGVLQITAVTNLDDVLVAKLLRVMSVDRLRGKSALPDVHQWTAPKFIVSAISSQIVVGVDGEREEYTSPVTITLMPRALRLYVPAEGVRGRAKNPFSAFIAGRLWRGAVHGGTGL